jgi:predicted dehydrogenase
MNQHAQTGGPSDLNRRDFLKGGSFATLMAALGGMELSFRSQKAAAADASQPYGPKVKCGVIGLGPWGRDKIVGVLSRLPDAEIAAVCDTYPASLRRGAEKAPGATATAEYRAILDNKEIKAVFVATPSHTHRDIAVAALQAGKHVYCEAPLATTIEDAKAIAKAAEAAPKQVFQAGLQTRSDPQRHFLLSFIRSGAMGANVKARAQWHKQQMWRFTSPNPDREKALNWRLRKETSPGLIGEIGVHQLDAVAWFLRAQPTAVTGFGSVIKWDDGREVPDTVQAVFEFPGNVTFSYECTLANSFDSDYEIYYGTEAAILVRENKAWLFKEVNSKLLGWEVYARKDVFYRETGIALVANASKPTGPAAEDETLGAVPAVPYEETALEHALKAFLGNVNEISGGVEDFVSSFNPNDEAALKKYLADLTLQPYAGYREGYEAAAMALKANEAILKRQRLVIPKELFELA